MAARDKAFFKRLLATFKVEAQEHIHSIASDLVELEKTSTEEAQTRVLDRTFRCAHSLKGAARTVGAAEIEALCQPLEGAFAALKRRELAASPELFDLFHRVLDRLDQLLPFSGDEAPTKPKPAIADLVDALRSTLTGNPPGYQTASPGPRLETVSNVSAPEPARSVADTVRVSASKLDAILRQSEELLFAKLAAAQQALRLRHLQSRPAEWKKCWARLQPELRAVRQFLETQKRGNGSPSTDAPLMRLLEFLEWNHGFIETLDGELTDLAKKANHDHRTVGTMVDDLLDDMKTVVTQPFSTLLDAFPRFVRELSREQGKEVDLLMRGGEIEIDRRILDEIKDPLIHLMRNCLDHGIEPAADRVKKGKPGRGTIQIEITSYRSGHVELVLADDGSGIDINKTRAAAVSSGALSPSEAEALNESDALCLVFKAGFSTSSLITDISGRGLGLAIVKEKIEKLNGTLIVETEPDKGTAFRMILPLTSARFRGVVVRVGEHLLVLPTTNVDRAVRVRRADVKTVENRATINLSGRPLSLVPLRAAAHLAGKPSPAAQREPLFVVVLAHANQRIALEVDEILNEQEVLVKTLGKQLAGLRTVSGATVLGSGKVAPILNVPGLMQAAIESAESATAFPAAVRETMPKARKSVLVAEDSITSRTLLKSIIETAGYQVETSVDGIDALTKLRSGNFDLVVSDVDMPRLNGFGLTAKIRADQKFANLPVVLVTALESRQDRERGIDAGANAYLVKSTFDQSNLLEVIRRLI